jgi:hypothetical protein
MTHNQQHPARKQSALQCGYSAPTAAVECDRLSPLASRMTRQYIEQVSENRERAQIEELEHLSQQ